MNHREVKLVWAWTLPSMLYFLWGMKVLCILCQDEYRQHPIQKISHLQFAVQMCWGDSGAELEGGANQCLV